MLGETSLRLGQNWAVRRGALARARRAVAQPAAQRRQLVQEEDEEEQRAAHERENGRPVAVPEEHPNRAEDDLEQKHH